MTKKWAAQTVGAKWTWTLLCNTPYSLASSLVLRDPSKASDSSLTLGFALAQLYHLLCTQQLCSSPSFPSTGKIFSTATSAKTEKSLSALSFFLSFFSFFFFFPIYLFSCNLSQVYLILLLGKQKFWRCLVWMFGWDDLHCCTLGRFSFLLVVVCFICLFFPWSHDTGTWAHQPCGFLSTSRWLNKWWIDVPWPTRNMLLSYLCFRTNVYTTKF